MSLTPKHGDSFEIYKQLSRLYKDNNYHFPSHYQQLVQNAMRNINTHAPQHTHTHTSICKKSLIFIKRQHNRLVHHGMVWGCNGLFRAGYAHSARMYGVNLFENGLYT